MTSEIAYLENIIALLPGHIYWKDRNGIFLGCNDEQAKFIGLKSRHDVKGLTALTTLPKDFAEEIMRIDQGIIESGIPQTVEETLTLPNGQNSYWLSKKVPLRDTDGKIIGLLGISLDITEKRHLAEELIKTKTRLDGMTLLGASIAHELRTPFASLNVTAKTLETKINNLAKKTELPEENITSLQHDVSSIKKEVKASLTFIDMLLMNINPTINEAKIEDFSMRHCITDALERFPFVGKQHELVIWDEKKNPDFIVHGEQLLLIHVFFNLLKNSLYYIAKARKGNIDISIKDHAVYFKDTGTGIEKEHLPHIFKRFFSKTYHGAGIGLTFCQWVMDNLGGEITCESEEGHYTLFILRFPNNI
ncbi:MAG TPA: ATP-binding protein [Gammaproteobacteria bacterium]|nr:ATP-binding protein [Gammaproteobacteria bacterium]